MNYKFHLSILTGATLIAILVTLIAPTFTGAVGPTANPPDNAGLVPNFSGLNVSGDTTIGGILDVASDIVTSSNMEANGNVSIGTDLSVQGDTTLNTASISRITSDLDFRGKLSNQYQGRSCTTSGWFCSDYAVDVDDKMRVRGHLQADSIGKVNVIQGSQPMPAGQLVNTATATCPAESIRLGCGGGFNGGLPAKLNSIVPSYGWGEACLATADNSAGGASTLHVYAICFDPDGT